MENPVYLVASHCKPWRDATNEERLDDENGLLLTPSVDHLFDRGFIGFEDRRAACRSSTIARAIASRPSTTRTRPRPFSESEGICRMSERGMMRAASLPFPERHRAVHSWSGR